MYLPEGSPNLSKESFLIFEVKLREKINKIKQQLIEIRKMKLLKYEIHNVLIIN